MTVRLLHLADLHLDSAYGGREGTRRRLREATFEALRAATRHAVDERLDAVLIAGDAFDDERLGYDARAELRGAVQRLVRAGIDVVYVTGNHDPGAPARRAAGLGLERVGGGRHGGRVVLALDGTPRATTLRRRGEPYLHVVCAGHGHGRVTDDLAATLVRPDRGDGLPAVAVLHTQVGSARGADGHAAYAPSTPAVLREAGFDYWALGHVHVQGRAADDAPAWYAGNLVGRNPKETGPKGGLLVELDGAGLVAAPRPLRFAPVEFVVLHLAPRRGGGALATPEAVARAAAELWPTALAARGGDCDLAPELVLRLTGDVLAPSLARDLGDPEARAAAEDAVGAELEPTLDGARLLEVQLRLAAAPDDAPPFVVDGPSALAEALALADEVAAAGALPEGPDGPLAVEWARPLEGDALALAAARARAELVARAARLARGDEG